VRIILANKIDLIRALHGKLKPGKDRRSSWTLTRV